MDERVTKHQWWHTIELSPGVVTPGGWELRPTAAELPWPDVAGKRCLDIGTADGFWAFELERRGAAEVVATDLPSAFQARARARFELARELRGSSVTYEERDVYDLEGEYDIVFMGFVLQMVRDPIGALAAIRGVSAGATCSCSTPSACRSRSCRRRSLASMLAATPSSTSSSTGGGCGRRSSLRAGRSRRRPGSSVTMPGRLQPTRGATGLAFSAGPAR